MCLVGPLISNNHIPKSSQFRLLKAITHQQCSGRWVQSALSHDDKRKKNTKTSEMQINQKQTQEQKRKRKFQLTYWHCQHAPSNSSQVLHTITRKQSIARLSQRRKPDKHRIAFKVFLKRDITIFFSFKKITFKIQWSWIPYQNFITIKIRKKKKKKKFSCASD